MPICSSSMDLVGYGYSTQMVKVVETATPNWINKKGEPLNWMYNFDRKQKPENFINH